jgi:hypothetical protein
MATDKDLDLWKICVAHEYGEHIVIRCEKHPEAAAYTTKNISPIGARNIFAVAGSGQGCECGSARVYKHDCE